MILNPSPSLLRRLGAAFVFLVGTSVLGRPIAAQATDSFEPFNQYTLVVSAEGGFNHFGGRLNSTFVQTWDLAARFSIFPFDPVHMDLLGGALDGAFEVGLQPIFERFETLGQNFGGMGLALRYYLLHWRFGRFVPYVSGSAAPGGTDLNIPSLRGPFMFVLQASVGLTYFATEHVAFYGGYQLEHVSNAYTHRLDWGLESPGGAVFGVSYFFH
jgi:hypothetical protein